VSERDFIDEFLLRSSAAGMRFSRNNSGVAFHRDGSVVSYGCFAPGGSDLLGWVPHLITPDNVGKRVAVFSAVELKTGRQLPSAAQKQFLRAVERAGGFGTWGRDVETIMKRLEQW
jgi:hypothetical protein